MNPARTFRTSLCVVMLLVCSPLQAREIIENFLGMRFVKIPAGEFIMGTQDPSVAIMEIAEPEANALADEQPAHRVIISRPFYIGETEVTHRQWFRVMNTKPGPAQNWNRGDCRNLPVSSISWHMTRAFIDEINTLDNAYRYRLPTEAEWEYVARGGSDDLRPVPADALTEHAWFIDNSGDLPHSVATRQPNAYGVYDMLGNVWEWVDDWYTPDAYSTQTRTDPQGPATGRSKVRRGGSFHCPLHQTRPGYRSANTPDTRYEVIGFRLVAEPM